MPGDADAPRLHVLLMERDLIVGYALAEDLAEFGYRVSGPCRSLDEAEELLDGAPPDGAIVDIGLADGAGFALTRRLRGAGIPVVFFSTADRRRYVEGEFRDVPWVDRPASTGRLLGAMGLPRGGARPTPDDPN